jgi:hypothetical protein
MATEQQRKALAVMALAEMWDKSLSEAGATMYVAALDGLNADEVERAAAMASRTCERFPPPAVLRELAGEQKPEDRAVAAWVQVEKAVQRHGSYRSVDFEDRTINAAIRSMGGWPALCGRPESDFDKWGRQDFVKAYTAFARMGVGEEAGAALPGLSTGGVVTLPDGTLGVSDDPPVYRIGGPERPSLPDRRGRRDVPRLTLSAGERPTCRPALELKPD